MKKVAFCTLGCKVNQYETNAMIEQFIKKGYEIVNFEEKADIYIINTCTVTNMADRKSRQMLRRVKEINREAIVVADVMYQKEFLDFGTTLYTEKTRAVIKVQDGCDRFCSYCIIPYARGHVRSRKPESVIEEIKGVAKEGIKEVVITGIHVASYGKDFKDDIGLIDLLEKVNEIEGIERIRLGSIEPTIITDGFLERLTKLEKICDHFHLSLQSGCDETLKRMNRKYTTEQFRKSTNLLKKAYPNVALTTDIIVGFPGETDEEFEKTYKFLKEIDFYKMHIFKYSPRKGTKAAVMRRSNRWKYKRRKK